MIDSDDSTKGGSAGWFPDPRASRAIRDGNPWHVDGAVPEALAPPYERRLVDTVTDGFLRNLGPRSEVIRGPRRVGKTTVLYQSVRRLIDQAIHPRRIWYFRLDHPSLIQVNLGDLVRYAIAQTRASAGEPVVLLLDEIAYSADWELWLKTFHDEGWPVRVAATASAADLLARGAHESGVGRWEELLLLPYTLPELCALRDIKVYPNTGLAERSSLRDVLEEMIGQAGREREPTYHLRSTEIERQRKRLVMLGGFPETQFIETWLPDARQRTLYSPDEWILHSVELERAERTLRASFIERAIYRDSHLIPGVPDPLLKERLLMTVADQIGGIISPRNLSGDLGVSEPTVTRYLHSFEQLLITFTVPNYSLREGSVQRRGRKLYFYDSTVRNAALLRSYKAATDRQELGHLHENLVAVALRGLQDHADLRLHYWRDGSREVDFIVNDPRGPVAIEVASSPDHRRDHLRFLMSKRPQFDGSCYLATAGNQLQNPHVGYDGIRTIPLDMLLLAIGHAAGLGGPSR